MGSLSEASRVFDARLLKPIIAGLLRDHRLVVDQPVDRSQGDKADLRDGLLLLPGLATEAELLKHIEKLKPQDTT
jgi:hypothetical protein